jgi:hypothetical protein
MGDIDWKFVLQLISGLFGLVASVLVFMLGRVFFKKEDFDKFKDDVVGPLEKRVQSVEETYVKTKRVDELDKRVGKTESSLDGLPDLVKALNNEVIELRMTAKFLQQSNDQVLHKLNLIIDAAMKERKI